ncbi:MAG: ClbS/DfsB family four-helix bundle protein [Oceanospirillaceae bacterium]|nr:ClbS/DfsB family four-helix bundle protein [Oceanospirillaceae bacterium]
MSSIPKNKEELADAIQSAFAKLVDDYLAIPEEHSRKIAIQGNVKNTEISVCDTLAYLIGWGELVLKWYSLKSKNIKVDFPETGYQWNELGQLARHFHLLYQDCSYEKLLFEFQTTTTQILQLIDSLSNDELYGQHWYEKYTLGRMIQFNTSSPMKNIRTKIRKFKKQID